LGFILCALIGGVGVRPLAAQDPRTHGMLRWTAPGEDDDQGIASGYEVRVSPSVPGSDLEAWWSAAAAQPAPPAPAPAGSIDTWTTGTLNPNAAAYAAVRARDAAGQWSPLVGVAAHSRPAAVFLHAVAPAQAEPGPVAFVLHGLGLGAVTQVRFHTPGGVVTGTSLSYDGAALHVAAPVTGSWAGAVDVEVLASGGSDVLRGWLTVTQPPPPEDTVAPQAVTDLAAGVVDSTSVLLTWTAPGDPDGASLAPVAFYEIRWFDVAQGGTYALGAPVTPPGPGVPGAPQSELVGGLPHGITASFQVVAFDAAHNASPLSNRADAALPAPDVTPPDVVTDLAVTVGVDDDADLTWTNTADDATGVAYYTIRRQDVAPEDFRWNQATPVATLPGYTPGSHGQAAAGTVPPGTVASFAIVAVDEAGNASAPSAAVGADRRGEDITAPSAPQDLEAGRFGSGRVQLRGRASGDDGHVGAATAYDLAYLRNPDPQTSWWDGLTTQEIASPPRKSGKRQFYNLGDLEGGAVYGFALRARDEAGNVSEWSVVYLYVDGAVSADAAPPAAPAGLTGTVGADGVRLEWHHAPEANVAVYVVLRGEPGGQPADLAAVPVGETAFLDADPLPGVCRYSVVSQNADGTRSVFAQWITVTIPGGDALTVTATGQGYSLSVAAPGETVPPVVRIFDVRGRFLAAPEAAAGNGAWNAAWDGADVSGRPVRSGVVFIRVQSGHGVRVHKLLVAR